jgi:hypothetical protein
MSWFENLVGQKFGKLTVVEYAGNANKYKRHTWKCLCDCGKEKLSDSVSLKGNSTRSCGCLTRFFRDLTGKRFGRLLVTSYHEVGNRRGSSLWNCVCDCGKEVVKKSSLLMGGSTNSCGCLVAGNGNRTHGLSRTPEYVAWWGMRRRCLPTSKDRIYYFKRGIRVCEQWNVSVGGFEAFLKFVGQRPSDAYSLDRINNNQGYQPGNVRWALKPVQMDNRQDMNNLEDRPLDEIEAEISRRQNGGVA